MPEMRNTQSLGLAIGILCVIGMMQNAGKTSDPVATTPRDGSVSNARPNATGSGEFPPLLFAAEGAKKILRYGRDGAVVWEYPAERCRGTCGSSPAATSCSATTEARQWSH